jgi:hypothetical protein
MAMKAETDPITEDEWLIRLVWETKLKVKDQAILIAANAFEPLPNDTDGLSLFRRACLKDPGDALLAIAVEEKRRRYAIAQVPASLLPSLGLSVRSAPIAAVPGHVVIPEINIADYTANKARFTPVKQRLAEVASENVLRWPMTDSAR